MSLIAGDSGEELHNSRVLRCYNSLHIRAPVPPSDTDRAPVSRIGSALPTLSTGSRSPASL